MNTEELSVENRELLAWDAYWEKDGPKPALTPVESPSAPEPEPAPEPVVEPAPVVYSDDPALRELQEAHVAINSRLPFEELKQFVGLPDWLRVIPTGSTKGGSCSPDTKVPIEKEWNAGGKVYSPLELLSLNGYVRSNALGAGAPTGSVGNGLIIVDFDEPPDPELAGFAEETFKKTYGKPSSDLPPAPRLHSGKPGRVKLFLRVPHEWWESLANWSLSTGKYNKSQNALEVLWETAAQTGKHGTILGVHPDSTPGKPLIYRWEEGSSPADVGVPDAPVWFLAKCVELRAQHIAPVQTVEKLVEGDENQPKPFDLLKGHQQFQLIDEASKFLPVRGAEHPGNYEPLRRAVCGVIDYWGLDAGIQILSETSWHQKNDYSYHGLGSLEEWLTSLHKSQVPKELKAHIGSFFGVAEDNGWKFPDWAKPPSGLDHGFMATTIKSVKFFKDSWEQIKLLESPVERRMAMKTLRTELKLSSPDFVNLIRDLATEQHQEKDDLTTVEAIMAADLGVRHVVNGLIAFGCLTVLAAESGCGKSAFFYAAGESIAAGGKFLDVFETVQSKVLFIQCDEPVTNAREKWKRMDFKDANRNMEFRWAWTPSQLLDLEQEIIEKKIGVVFMDSLGTLFGAAGDSLNDPEVGMYMYELNKLAGRTGAAIVLTHHLKKREPDKDGKPKPVRLNELFGSQYIVAGVSDVWGLWRTDSDAFLESSDGDPRFSLRYLKHRSMLQSPNFTFNLEGSLESLRFNLDEHGEGGLKRLEGRQTLRKQLLSVLRQRAGEWLLVEELKSNVGATNEMRSVRRALADLHSDSASTGVSRRPIDTERKGRPKYEYSFVR